jgi:hypothetical protein
MDNAFQELDYSTLSAKNLNKKQQPGILDTKTRGGLVRLIIIIIFIIIICSMGYSIFSNYKEIDNLNSKYQSMLSAKDNLQADKLTIEEEATLFQKEGEILITQIEEAKKYNQTMFDQVTQLVEKHTQSKTESEQIIKTAENLEQEYNLLLEKNKKYVEEIKKLDEENKILDEKIKSK